MGGRTRDRHGRGMRGPAIVPTRPGHPRTRTRSERFDDLALAIVTEIDDRWQSELGLIEYACEDTPMLPDDWAAESVPLATLVRGSGATPTRLGVFRRPIEQRAESREELRALVLTVVVEQIAELLGLPASKVDPRYED